MGRFTGLLGLVAIVAVAWLVSTARHAIRLRIILWGMGLQIAFAVIVLKTPVSDMLQKASDAIAAMFDYAKAGSTFVFGPLGVSGPPVGFIFAFQVLTI